MPSYSEFLKYFESYYFYTTVTYSNNFLINHKKNPLNMSCSKLGQEFKLLFEYFPHHHNCEAQPTLNSQRRIVRGHVP